MPSGAKMKLDIDKLETKLIERYGKEKWEKKLDDFYQKFHSKNYEYARRTLILGLSKFIAESSPSDISPQKREDWAFLFITIFYSIKKTWQ